MVGFVKCSEVVLKASNLLLCVERGTSGTPKENGFADALGRKTTDNLI